MAFSAVGCQAVLGLSTDTTVVEADAAIGRTAPDATDALRETTTARGESTYHDVSDPSYWSSFDVTTVDPDARNFVGGTFDGRYVYLAPSARAIVTRYDTQVPMNNPSSWSTFDAKSLALGEVSSAGGGAAFDGQFVYFITGSTVARYDSFAGFDEASAWATVSISQLATAGAFFAPADILWSGGAAPAFVGTAFDGQYLYLAPSQGAVAIRLDTTLPFAEARSWSAFDALSAGVNFTSSSDAYSGAVFDGHYIYFIPGGSLPVLQYDIALPFGEKGAWSIFGPTTVEAPAGDFRCGAYDGKALYLVPADSSLTLAYQTRASFYATSSWATFDTKTVSAGAAAFGGSAFDGRYLFFVPSAGSEVIRYDTRTAFTAAPSWTTFDLSTVTSDSGAFGGAVFDGRYVYLIPSGSGVIVRFDAKTPSSLPDQPENTGSFL